MASAEKFLTGSHAHKIQNKIPIPSGGLELTEQLRQVLSHCDDDDDEILREKKVKKTSAPLITLRAQRHPVDINGGGHEARGGK